MAGLHKAHISQISPRVANPCHCFLLRKFHFRVERRRAPARRADDGKSLMEPPLQLIVHGEPFASPVPSIMTRPPGIPASSIFGSGLTSHVHVAAGSCAGPAACSLTVPKGTLSPDHQRRRRSFLSDASTTDHLTSYDLSHNEPSVPCTIQSHCAWSYTAFRRIDPTITLRLSRPWR